MKIKTAKKMGFFTAVVMLIGTIVGSGIFFKNTDVFKFNDFSSIGILLSWIIASIMTVSIAYSFSEINRTKNSKLSGFLNWSHKYTSKHFNIITKFSFPTFMFMFNTMIVGYVFSYYGVKLFSLTGTFDANNVPVITHVCVSLVVVIIIKSLQYFAPILTGPTQAITTVIKFTPLILIIIVGIAMATTHNNVDVTTIVGNNLFNSQNAFNFSGMILAIPAILFAFDAFLNIGQITEHMEGEEKKAPKVTMVGISIVVVVYILVTIAQIVHGAGSVTEVLEDVLPAGAMKPIKAIVLTTIVISVYGGLNGYVYASSVVFEQTIRVNSMIGSRWLMKKNNNNEKKASSLLFLFWVAAFSFIGIVSSVITINDTGYSFMASWSNSTPLYSFITYIFILVFYWKRRNETVHNKMKGWVWKTSASIGIAFGIIFLGYQIFYVVSIETFFGWDWEKIRTNAIPFYLSLVWIFGLSYLNQYLLNKEHKKYPKSKIDINLINTNKQFN
ncbi:APC family permease [Candidatus Mycoplasma mahonii]|uniref:APC family permease n=1 Tax=Candidatus Mycoplasma mahonii TaxID=3004105 RepID=UPI0026EE76C9|nr:amino acid permease [Candidatus Mycoplasma mahonii]WKX02303.1 amino acid permease [Candidatus Mycoplasma mahonii]